MNTKRLSMLGLAVLVVLALVGCSMGGRIESTGSVLLSLDHVQARSILPPISMDPAEFLVTGAGPSGAVYGPAVLTGNTVLEDMLPGAWTFTVVARNAEHNAIGEGAGGVTVIIGQTATCTITVNEYTGDGSFLLDLAWEPDIVSNPQWAGSLKDFAAVVTPMAFTTDELTCTSQSLVDPLHSGWFLLLVQLYDGEVLSTGAAAAVRIAAGRQTHGDLFLHALQGYGSIDLLLDLNFGDELILTPSVAFGNLDFFEGQEQIFTVTADETATAVYYLRGQQVAVDSFTLQANDLQENEAYRVDVVVFNTDGSRAASGTWNVKRIPLPPESYTISGSYNNFENDGDCTMYLLDQSMAVVDTIYHANGPAGIKTFAFSGVAAGNYYLQLKWHHGAYGDRWETWQEQYGQVPAAPTLIARPLQLPLPSYDFGSVGNANP